MKRHKTIWTTNTKNTFINFCMHQTKFTELNVCEEPMNGFLFLVLLLSFWFSFTINFVYCIIVVFIITTKKNISDWRSHISRLKNTKSPIKIRRSSFECMKIRCEPCLSFASSQRIGVILKNRWIFFLVQCTSFIRFTLFHTSHIIMAFLCCYLLGHIHSPYGTMNTETNIKSATEEKNINFKLITDTKESKAIF